MRAMYNERIVVAEGKLRIDRLVCETLNLYRRL